MFKGGKTFMGANLCAYDRTQMLAGNAATQVCVQLRRLMAAHCQRIRMVHLPSPQVPQTISSFMTTTISTLRSLAFHAEFRRWYGYD
jgi:hypothetical protein